MLWHNAGRLGSWYSVSQMPLCRPQHAAVKSLSPPQTSKSTIETVYNMARDVFRRGRTATPAEIDALSGLLGKLPLCEVGLLHRASAAKNTQKRSYSDQQAHKEENLLGKMGLHCTSTIPEITYLHICENSDFALGIFCLPLGVDLPLHDHPQMTVMSRVMYGKLQVKAYDWVEGSSANVEFGKQQPAKLAVFKDLQEGDPPIVLYPNRGGNVHKFKAETHCAVLDLMSPPYDMNIPERSCTYFKECSATRSDGTTLLEKMPEPNSFEIVASLYEGIKVE